MMHRPDPPSAPEPRDEELVATPQDGPADDRPAEDRAPLAAALHRALDKVAAAAADPDPVEMVHDARKAMKAYRALLRLVGTKAAGTARRAAAEVTRNLASARNRATAQEALDLLEGAGLALPCDLAEARAALGPDAAEAAEAEHLRGDLARFVDETRAHFAATLEAEAAEADLVVGLGRGYRAARRAHLTTPEAMHEARKRVVAHRYQMSFLADHFGGRGAKRAGRAQRLRDVLGAYQDIETLRPMLHHAAPTLHPMTLERLERCMMRLQKRLKREARLQHKALFHSSPRRFEHKFASLVPIAATAEPEALDDRDL